MTDPNEKKIIHIKRSIKCTIVEVQERHDGQPYRMSDDLEAELKIIATSDIRVDYFPQQKIKGQLTPVSTTTPLEQERLMEQRKVALIDSLCKCVHEDSDSAADFATGMATSVSILATQITNLIPGCPERTPEEVSRKAIEFVMAITGMTGTYVDLDKLATPKNGLPN